VCFWKNVVPVWPRGPRTTDNGRPPMCGRIQSAMRS